VRLADSRDKSRRYDICGLETGQLNGAAISSLQPVRLDNLPPGRHSNNNTHQPSRRNSLRNLLRCGWRIRAINRAATTPAVWKPGS